MKRVLIFLPILVALCMVGCSAEIPTPNIYNTGINPDSWVRVPAGEFLMGQFNERTMINYNYEIMVTPVTNTQYAKYLNTALDAKNIEVNTDNEVIGYYPGDAFHAERHEVEIKAGKYLLMPLSARDVRIIFKGGTFSVKTGYENHPVTMVTWFGANAYCKFYNYSLPTEAEWEKAARGTEGLPYPWGEEIKRNNANFYHSGDPFEKYAGKLGNTTPVGFYNGKTYDGYRTLDSASPYGLYDMAGNVWEWTGNIYEGIHYRYLRGGSKADYEHRLRVWSRDNAGPDYYSPNAGFRAVRIV